RGPAPAVPPASARPSAGPSAGPPPAGEAVRPFVPAAPASVPVPGPVPEDPEELPRRVRQASLAPQLREAPARPGRAGAVRSGAGGTGRNPEEARAAMSAFQQGWARGRGPQRPAAPDRPSPRGEIR
ncbi:hypothetical protein ACFVXI_00005, partial [Kitasatospora herbaricolor]